MTSMTRRQMVEQVDDLLADAFVATRKILTDPNAPPTARASAVSSAIAIRRQLVDENPSNKDPSEMTYDELQESIEALRRQTEDIS